MMFLSFQKKEPEIHQLSVESRGVLNPQRAKMSRIQLSQDYGPIFSLGPSSSILDALYNFNESMFLVIFLLYHN